jgi:hypothetical protein
MSTERRASWRCRRLPRAHTQLVRASTHAHGARGGRMRPQCGAQQPAGPLAKWAFIAPGGLCGQPAARRRRAKAAAAAARGSANPVRARSPAGCCAGASRRASGAGSDTASAGLVRVRAYLRPASRSDVYTVRASRRPAEGDAARAVRQ